MPSRVYVKYVRNLTDDEYKQCYAKNLGPSGRMRRALTRSYSEEDDGARAVLIKENGEIIAWAYVFDGYESDDNKCVFFWVVPKHRRKGLGSRLMYHVRKIDSTPYVFPWDTNSGRFFKKFVDTIAVSDWDAELLDA